MAAGRSSLVLTLYRSLLRAANQIGQTDGFHVRKPMDLASWSSGKTEVSKKAESYWQSALETLTGGRKDLVAPPDGLYTGQAVRELVQGEFRKHKEAEGAEKDSLVDSAFATLRGIGGQLAMEQRSSLAETRGILVDATSACIAPGSSTGIEPPQWMFTYRIRVSNVGQETVQLQGRHWLISNQQGHLVSHVPAGSTGVIGYQPVLKPGESFQYYSAAHLDTPEGRMEGGFNMVALRGGDEEDQDFYAQVAPFKLA